MKFRYLCLSGLLVVAGCGGGGGGARVNQVPTITGLADVTISANESAVPINVIVNDDGGAAAVTVTASSDNADLINAAGLVVDGSGGTRTLVITPNPDVIGMATVSVDAVDAGGRGAQRSFVVVVERQMAGFSDYFRSSFADQPNDQPRDVNSRQFNDDGQDDYADLITP